ncbi:phage holin family protein [Brevibacillus massiliensis]|jgi:cytochrome bd-type quinol oxidase subunit 2|uniref:phage holin family protein n=1 Tax=Brevibacillus massiliensis TaxID=1118054 RepID=UPI000382EFD8|nr:phage holin family protein [Brevibacillus massiliensis]
MNTNPKQTESQHSVREAAKEWTMLVIGIVLCLFGLLLLIGALASDSDFTQFGELVSLLVLAILPLVLGIWLCITARKRTKRRKADELENRILQLAQQLGGSLTAAELAMHTSVSFSEAQRILDAFVKMKIAFIKISDNGTMIYEFEGLISQVDKQRAQSLKELIYSPKD